MKSMVLLGVSRSNAQGAVLAPLKWPITREKRVLTTTAAPLLSWPVTWPRGYRPKNSYGVYHFPEGRKWGVRSVVVEFGVFGAP